MKIIQNNLYDRCIDMSMTESYLSPGNTKIDIVMKIIS